MFKQHSEGIVFTVKVIPKSSKNAIVGWEGEYLKVRIAAIPDKGQANKELICYLSEIFECPKSEIILLQGEGSRIKRILLRGQSLDHSHRMTLLQKKL